MMFKTILVFLWDTLFLWLLKNGPRLFHGTSGAYEHGAKTRTWLYNHWLPATDAATKSGKLGAWDESGLAWVGGFMQFPRNNESGPQR